MITKKERVKKRHRRLRNKVQGTSQKPRLCVSRSLQHIYAQLIDDDKGKTLACASDLELEGKKSKSEKAKAVGKLVAEKAQALKIKKAVFDRGGYFYHGRVKALADGAREGGLEF